MKTVKILLCILVLLLIAVPVSADTPTITSFSPPVGYQSTTATVTITGTNFNTTSEPTVLLMKSGKDNETASSITSYTGTSIVCRFTGAKLSDMDTGSWYLVVVNADNSEVKASTAFTLRAPMTLTSITPVKARTNNESIDVVVAGTGLTDVSGLQLYNEDYGNVSASDVDAASATKVTGTFDLTDVDVDTYEVCVKDSFGTRKCDLSFAVTSDAVGSIDVSSKPSGASLILDGVIKGTTPITVDDLEAGSYKVILKKDGYSDWTRTAKVTDGSITTYDAVLEVIRTATATTAATPVPTTAPTTVRTTVKSTIKTPTPWPTDTPTQASPLEGASVLGAVTLGILALHRKY